MKTKIHLTIILICLFAVSYAQIPITDFENWTNSVSYDIPNSWDNLNSMTVESGIYTCVKGTPGAAGIAGTYCIKLTSKKVSGMGVVPGIAVSGTLDKTTFLPKKGFAFNQRPANLIGNWQYMKYGTVAGYVDVKLTRWDPSMKMSITVASVHSVLTGMKMSWKPFTIPLTYIDNDSYPDSCIITLAASGSTPTEKDFLYIDNLAFSGAVNINSINVLVPNPDFETWINTGNYVNPFSWDNLDSKTSAASIYTCEKGTPGASGTVGTSYLMLTSKTVPGMGVVPGIAVSGTLDQTTMLPKSGFAFNQRPSAFTGNWQYMEFLFDGINAGYIDIQLTRWDPVMKMRMPVAGVNYSLPGMVMDWEAFSIPLTYVDNANYPDSCIIKLSASGSTPTQDDFLYVDDLSFSGAVPTDPTLAQIPNSDFENWNSSLSYNNPESWDNINCSTTACSIYTCEKGTPGATGIAGTYYLKLTSKSITGMGVVPGLAVSGTLDKTTMLPKTGFAFTGRPSSMTGYWQYMKYGAVPGFIDVQLTRWDSTMKMRMTVASVHSVLSGMKMSWKIFDIPLAYVDFENNPDTCIITLSASGNIPTNKDFLYVDNLAFSGIVATNIADIVKNKKFNVYPNPSISTISFDLPTSNDSKINFQISDLQGKTIMLVKDMNVTPNVSIDVADLPKGNYFIKVTLVNDVFVSHFIKL